MTTFASDGFLSDEIANVTADFAARYSRELDLVSRTNRLAHKILFGIQVRPDQVADLLLAILVARQIESFQAFVALLRIGLVSQAEIIIRTIAETMFLVAAIRKDAEFAARYVLADELSRRRSLIRLTEERKRRGAPPDEEVEALVKELEARIKDEKIQKLTTEQIADLAGLEAYYDTIYGAFSMAVHSSIRSLERVLVPDAEGRAISIDYGPVLDRLEMHFDFALDMTLIVLAEAAEHFNGDAKTVNELRQQLKKMSDVRKAG